MELFYDNSTITAICTAPGMAGISIVRLSGADAYPIADAFCKNSPILPSAMAPGTFRLFHLRDPSDASPIDEAIVLAFRAPNSYTGEDVIEFQIHGGRISATRVMKGLIHCGARPAEPGEFSKRAFLNGRMDLSEAEAVIDIISAQSERAGRAAAEQLEGSLGRRVNACYDELMTICADVEASLDFADYESTGILEEVDVTARISDIRSNLEKLAATWREGILLREGALVVLSGIPNSGKSTLFNAMLGAFRSIVTDIPGTTRDSIEEAMLLNGIPLRITDTAGLRDSDGIVERIGIDRAKKLIANADVNLRIIDMTAEIEPQLSWIDDTAADPLKTIAVLNKSDIAPRDRVSTLPQELAAKDFTTVIVSAKTGAGIDELKAAMTKKICDDLPDEGGQDVAVSTRHHTLLKEGIEALDEALELYKHDAENAAVFCAQSLRRAAESIGEITGRTYSEDLLDIIFSRFCIGK
ncbi:MAG: tRNA uridine-5-carboxymethylaminomethyl(34) synthesis GTPase MnmE [Lentisphaerae bacterium]|jgi:tRNA modification GTPase|nr:tRNA uridine-5-carboxymethylaminomethyl(34) synthesis GTPase MnmE [Lentisphaerota bacterium]